MEKFLAMYNSLNGENLHLLKDLYRADIRFIDPAHEIYGLDNLTDYFFALYENLYSIDFTFHDVVKMDNLAYLQWDMTFSHKKFSGGRPIVVSGTTFLQFDNEQMVYYHRDYFDLGAMLYEQLPLLGRLIKAIKGRLGK